MGCLYLHIGTPKTGTTSIQIFLAKNRELLSSKNFCYPDLGYRFDNVGKHRNAHFLIQRYYDEKKQRLYEQEEALRNEGMQKVLELFQTSDNIILSDESIWNQSYFVDDFWLNLKEILAEHGHRIKVIAYLRRQDAYIRSYWAESAKADLQVKSFTKYVDSNPQERLHADYFRAMDLIASCIGTENIIIRPFEKGQFVNNNLLDDFLDCVGLTLTDEYVLDEFSRNPAVAGEFIQSKQILNTNPAFAERKSFMLPLIIKATRHRGGNMDYRRAALFTDMEPSEYNEQFREGNEQVARKFLNREDGVLFYEEPESEKDLEPYSAQELVNACGDIILELKNQIDEALLPPESILKQLKLIKKLIKRRIRVRLRGQA
ncbi:MAG: hypothetical protein J1E62_10955 [Lachnospiraceae bacterium]|nr:hypothetical protein [Lachnospiraceae bacterium]